MTTLAHAQPAVAQPQVHSPSLAHLLEDGIYLVFLLRNGWQPDSATTFNAEIDQLLLDFDRLARNYNKPVEAIQEAKYALCALLDEVVLSTPTLLRDEWERQPLQLRLFGEHLAGEGFFDHLERLRFDPVTHHEALEMYYQCLLLGFQGKYLLEGTEKLQFLITRVGQELTGSRGKAELAPHARPGLQLGEMVRHELPLWGFYVLLVALGFGLFVTYWSLLHWQKGDQPANLTGPARMADTRPAGSEG